MRLLLRPLCFDLRGFASHCRLSIGDDQDFAAFLHEQLLQRFLLFACCLKAALRLARLVLTVRSDGDGDDSLSLFLLAAPTWRRASCP